MSLLTSIWNHPANRNRRLMALIHALKWQCSKRLSGRSSDITFHGLTLRCYPNSHSASRAIYFHGYPDFHEMRFIKDYLRPGDIFIDVGANVGLYTLLAMSIVQPHGHVHSFEPGALTFQRLQQVLDLNQLTSVTSHNMAVSDTNGTVAFNNTLDDCTAHIEAESLDNSALLSVPVVRLDTHLPDVPYAMIKLDIEGHEPFALRGASTWLKNGNPPVIQIEMAGYSKRYGITTSEFIQELRDCGYLTAVYSADAHRLEWTERPWEVPTDNVLAVFENHKQFVDHRIAAARQASRASSE